MKKDFLYFLAYISKYLNSYVTIFQRRTLRCDYESLKNHQIWNSCFNPYFWLILSWKSNFYVRDSSLIHILTTSSISVDRSISIYILVVYYIKLFFRNWRECPQTSSSIQRVRVFPVVWQCIAVGMVLFSVVNTMFMPEWGLNCCGSTQSIIAPIYFFVNLTQIFDLYLHLSTTDVIFIMIWLEKKKEEKRKNGLRF